ncbi:MAG: hypothetical protein ABI835_13470 [Chloroflexota bacterium]
MSEIAMLVFPSRGTMLDAVDRIKSLSYAKIKHSAIIAKAEDGETMVYEDDINPNEGGVAGGTLGALMGGLGIAGLGAFLLPGVGAIIAIGAGALLGGLVGGATGGITAGLMDMGIDNAQLEALAEHLNAGKIAMVVELDGDQSMLSHLSEDLKPFQVEIVQQ